MRQLHLSGSLGRQEQNARLLPHLQVAGSRLHLVDARSADSADDDDADDDQARVSLSMMMRASRAGNNNWPSPRRQPTPAARQSQASSSPGATAAGLARPVASSAGRPTSLASIDTPQPASCVADSSEPTKRPTLPAALEQNQSVSSGRSGRAAKPMAASQSSPAGRPRMLAAGPKRLGQPSLLASAIWRETLGALGFWPPPAPGSWLLGSAWALFVPAGGH